MLSGERFALGLETASSCTFRPLGKCGTQEAVRCIHCGASKNLVEMQHIPLCSRVRVNDDDCGHNTPRDVTVQLILQIREAARSFSKVSVQ